MTATVYDQVWAVPQHEFLAGWGAAGTLDGATAAIRALADGPVPRWAAMARASALRKEGVPLQLLTAATRPTA